MKYMAALLSCCCGVSCRPDDISNQRGMSSGSKRVAALLATWGVPLGPWSWETRSFDALRRAGRVAGQASTAAHSTGAHALVVEMDVRRASGWGVWIEGVWTRCAGQSSPCVAALPKWVR